MNQSAGGPEPSSPAADAGHRDLAAWLLVAAQAVLLGAVVLLPGPQTAVPSVLRGFGLLLEIAGLLIVVAGAAQLGVSLNVLPTPNASGQLRTGGLYRIVRHPIYFGVLLFAVGAALRAPTVARVAAVVALAGLLRGKAAWEERRLMAKYSDYAEYASRTAAIWPLRRPGRRG